MQHWNRNQNLNSETFSMLFFPFLIFSIYKDKKCTSKNVCTMLYPQNKCNLQKHTLSYMYCDSRSFERKKNIHSWHTLQNFLKIRIWLIFVYYDYGHPYLHIEILTESNIWLRTSLTKNVFFLQMYKSFWNNCIPVSDSVMLRK